VTQSYYTLGQVARHFGVQLWQVRRLYERRLLPEPPRVGTYRIIEPRDLERVGAALRRAGYLRGEVQAAAGGPADAT
jgi:DNA-binding transcriptional MerR regulator